MVTYCLELIFNLLFENQEIIAEYLNDEVVKLLKGVLNDEVQVFIIRTTRNNDFSQHIINWIICI
jgi:hypothetical protein